MIHTIGGIDIPVVWLVWFLGGFASASLLYRRFLEAGVCGFVGIVLMMYFG